MGYAAMLWLADNAAPARPVRSAALRGWLVGLGYFGVSTWWVGEAFLVDAKDQGWMAPFAAVLLAGGLALFWAAALAVYRWAAPRGALRLLVFAGAMAGAEWLRGSLFTGFPWDLPGETWKAGSAVSQTASLVGAYGLTWITLAVAAAPGLGWRRTDARIAIATCVLALAGLYGFGAWRLAHAVTAAAANAPLVRVVQPDTHELPDYDAAAFANVVHRNLALTTQPSAHAPDVVIWSEQGIPAALGDYLAPGTWTEAAIEQALQPGQLLLTGGYRTLPAPPGAYAPEGLVYRNSLVALQRTVSGLKLTAVYDKHRLTPFGEYLPFDRWLGPMGLNALIHVGSGFTPGPPPRPMVAAGAPPVQPLICYESLYPDFVRDGALAAHLRPDWIVNVSDDAWFGVTSGPWQHLNIASYRAIEVGLPMVRATPTGVSAIIDAYGRIAPGHLLGQGGYGVIDAPLPPALAPTPFYTFGETGFFGFLTISLISIVLGRSAILRRNGKDH